MPRPGPRALPGGTALYRLLSGESVRVVVRVSTFQWIYEETGALGTRPSAKYTSVETVSPPNGPFGTQVICTRRPHRSTLEFTGVSGPILAALAGMEMIRGSLALLGIGMLLLWLCGISAGAGP